MPQVPRTSPATGLPTPRSFVHTTAFAFVDTHGRTLLLRGVNLSGASKAPAGRLSHVLEDFWESAGAEEDADCWYGEGEEEDGESAVIDSDDDDEGGRGSDSDRGSSRSSSRRSGKGKGREKLSFVGRPLRLEDGSADVHLARLRGWGFNLLRFPFTWESLEHEGPGKYDYEFMDYTIQVLSKCKEYGFRVYMDPHQDTWSRFSGGSGAPFWTLPACGINPRHITATQAALLHCEYPSPYSAHGPSPATLPAMAWSTNYGRLLSQTVFTLFFAGRDFAPNCIIDGVNIQDYLQGHYIEAVGRLVDRIRAHDDALVAQGLCARGEGLLDACVIGWDSMNEPFEGLCGWGDLSVNPTEQGSTLKKGTYPTPAQSLRLGMGQKQTVEHWTFGAMGPARDGVVEIDPKGKKVWADPAALPPDADADPLDSTSAYTGGELPDGTHPRWGWTRDVSRWPLGTCVWAQHGVWDVATGFVLRPAYFATHPATGLEVEFLSDYWKPHWLAYAARVRRSHPEGVVFVQPPVFAIPPQFTEAELGGRTAYAPHYYDGLTLVTRHWNWFNADALGLLRGKYTSALRAVKLGEGAIRRSLHEQLGYLQNDVAAPACSGDGGGGGTLGGIEGRGYPTVIGEIGTPFDMDGKRAYGWTDGGRHQGDYGAQEKALDASLQACDAWMLLKGRDREREREGSGKEGGGRADGSNGRGDSLNWTVWTYVPDDHSHAWGDGWNMEDLSLWSVDDVVQENEDQAADADTQSGECCCCCCGEAEDAEDADAQRHQSGSGEGVYSEMMQDMRRADEETLHSRAVLLMDGEREANALANLAGAGAHASSTHACACSSSRRRERRERKKLSRANTKADNTNANSNANSKADKQQQQKQMFRQQQPGRSLPMTAALSSLTLATLGSSTSLGMDLHAISQTQRQRLNRSQSQQQGGGIGGNGAGGRGREGRPRSQSKVSVASTASFGSMDSASTDGSSLVQHRHGHGHKHHRRSCPHHRHHTRSAHALDQQDQPQSPTPSTAIPPALARLGYSPNPYTFLTNGARAVRAFARPWPVAVVGRAVDVRFEIGKGVFKMVVWVGWEDRPPPSRAFDDGTGAGAEAEEDDGEEGREKRMPTEVFLPLVHYAHPRLLESPGSSKEKGSKKKNNVVLADERGRGGYPPTASMASLVAPHDGDGNGEVGGRGMSLESSVTLAPLHMHGLKPVLSKSSSSSDEDSPSPSPTAAPPGTGGRGPAPVSMTASSTGTTAATLVNTPTPALASCTASTSSSATATTTVNPSTSPNTHTGTGINITNNGVPAPLLISNTTADPLIDVEVSVSGGRYAVRGQSVLWWYDIPKEGEARREYVMEVKRRGGAMKRPPTKTKAKARKKNAQGAAGCSSASASVMSFFAGAGSREKFGDDKEREKRRRERKSRTCCESLCDEQGGLLGGCVIA
ncbi:hypothetical protein CVT25_011635 [Psilocybe cyanescens]|uniref:Glycoside hydrolase family 5 domain-containing protein n=1 Tax=Psilocybe cyanescens TaxID=93625 RepID=A0A409WIM5_PSICY|nr:hypothetical protein CVT25_011635 [Psilocybe cyanescens]